MRETKISTENFTLKDLVKRFYRFKSEIISYGGTTVYFRNGSIFVTDEYLSDMDGVNDRDIIIDLINKYSLGIETA